MLINSAQWKKLWFSLPNNLLVILLVKAIKSALVIIYTNKGTDNYKIKKKQTADGSDISWK